MNGVPKLCYIEGCWAFFTTQPLERQWGDDWNDAPYEHNAGHPYEWREERGGEPWGIAKIAFESRLETPNAGAMNSSWSVEDINACKVPWLSGSNPGESVWAGITLGGFIQEIERSGGTVYLAREREGEEAQ